MLLNPTPKSNAFRNSIPSAKTILAITFLSISTLFISSCQKNGADSEQKPSLVIDEQVRGEATSSPSGQVCRTRYFCLYAGQTIDAGKVVIGNDLNNLYVIINSKEGFQDVADNIKIWVGDDLSTLPAAKNGPNAGKPIPGQFPYKITADPTYTWYTVTIPFSKIKTTGDAVTCNGKPLYVYVHLDAIANGKAETAWGGCVGNNIKRPGSWYYSISYSTACCDKPCGCN